MNLVETVINGEQLSRYAKKTDLKGPSWYSYSQDCLMDDLRLLENEDHFLAQPLYTRKKLPQIFEGDIIYSHSSGKAALVGPCHDGMIYSHGFGKVVPADGVDAGYLVFVINERMYDTTFQKNYSESAKKVLRTWELKCIEIDELPSLERQKAIARIYFLKNHLCWLKQKRADQESVWFTEILKKENNRHEELTDHTINV